jgi:3'(2'), 5'-bisphosphate nucleotidase
LTAGQSTAASRLLDEITTLVSQASSVVLEARKGSLAVRTKADLSPVTAADEAVESLIMEGLAKLVPGVPVTSEEATARLGAAPVGGEFVLLDPIDGTREYLAGRDEFAINVALVRGGRPVLGIVAAPALGLIWRAGEDGRAERMALSPGAAVSAAQSPQPIRCRSWPADDPVATVSRSHLDPATVAFLARLPKVRQVSSGSAIKLCRVAEGLADVYPRLATTHEWDVAAGHAVLAAAGGVVIGAQGAISYGNAAAGYVVNGFVAWGDPSAPERLGFAV